MYVEKTTQGFNIMDIPGELLQSIQTALHNQSEKLFDDELTKEDKRSLRKLNSLIEQEIKMQV